MIGNATRVTAVVTGGWRQLARMWEDIQVVKERDPAATELSGAILAPMLPALWLHRIAHEAYGSDQRLLARVLSLAGRTLSGGIEIHPGARIGRRLFIDHGTGTVIGATAQIGDDVSLYHQVTLGAVGWQRDNLRPAGERRHPAIGDRVVIGAGAVVLGPVTVGADSRIGAHATVTRDVPPGTRVQPNAVSLIPPVADGPNGNGNGAAPYDEPAPSAYRERQP